MRTQDSNAVIFFVVFFSVIGALWAFIMQLSRWRFRRLATNLSSKFIAEGFLKIGRIEGEIQGRRFVIEPSTSGRHSFTCISIACDNKGLPLYIDSRFFKDYSNPSFVYRYGDRDERVFVTHITLHNVPTPLVEARQHIQVAALAQHLKSVLKEENPFKGRHNIVVGQGTIRYVEPGVIYQTLRMREILNGLNAMSSQIETNPIT